MDLNRNYSYGWGLNSGSSGDPTSDTYGVLRLFLNLKLRRLEIFCFYRSSENRFIFSFESQARSLNPYSYCDTAIRYDIYADFSSEFAPTNQYLYGTVNEMLALLFERNNTGLYACQRNVRLDGRNIRFGFLASVLPKLFH